MLLKLETTLTKPHKLFVYGTLKKGQYFHQEFMSETEFISNVVATDNYSLYIDGMPHLVREKSPVNVKGELYNVDVKTLEALDYLWAPVYKRDVIEFINESGEIELAWAYLRPRHFKGYQYAWKESEYV